MKAQILVSQSEHQQAQAILSESLPESLAHSDVAVRKEMLRGIAFRISQDFPKAEQMLSTAEALAISDQRQILSEVLNAKAALQVDELKYDDAQATYSRSLALAREYRKTDSEASAQAGLAWLAMKQEHFDEAVERSQSALRLSRALGLQSLTATNLGNIAWGYFQLGDFENSLDFFKQAADASQRIGLTGYQSYWLAGVANAYRELHDYAAAEQVSRTALDLAQNLKNMQTVAQCLNDLTDVTLRSGRVDEAEQYNQQALKLQAAGLDHLTVLESLVLSGRIAARRGHFAEAEQVFRRVQRQPNTETALIWEAQARLAQVYSDEGFYAKAESQFRQSVQTVESVRSSVQAEDLRLSFLSTAIAFYDDYVDFLVARNRPGDALKIAELSRARTLADGLGTGRSAVSTHEATLRPQEIARRENAVILFYSLGENRSQLWAITPARMLCVTLPSQQQIASLVKSYRDEILHGHDVLAAANADGSKLYKILLQPVRRLIPRGSRVIVLPDESLYSLNFETLLVPDPKPHFWIEDVTVSTASSLTLLSNGDGNSSRGARDLLLVGNPLQAAPEFPVLRQAQTEMAHIQSYFPEGRRQVLAGAAATPNAFLNSKAENFAYVHFVTHGIASRAHPLDSAVILSPEGDSYKLYARDIVKQPLSAQLVTVSACNGSGVRAYSGEGLVGLSWAFLRAGAHNVISALWEVNDISTAQLMDQLYSHLSQREDPASALRAAKLALLRSDGVFRKPFYWAAFQLYSGS